MNKPDTIYCVHCGTKNNLQDLKCKKCQKKLKTKNQNLKDFLYKHIKADLKGKVEDNIFSLLKNFIKSHLYGSLMSLSIIFTISTIILANVDEHGNVKYINNLSDLNNGNKLKEVEISLYTYDDYCVYHPDIGTTSGYIISGEKYLITKINLKKGSTINEWCKNNVESIICKEEIYENDESINKNASEYRKLLNEYISWYKKCENNLTSKKCNKEYIDYNSKLSNYFPKLTNEFKNIFNKDNNINENISIYLPYLDCEYVQDEM